MRFNNVYIFVISTTIKTWNFPIIPKVLQPLIVNPCPITDQATIDLLQTVVLKVYLGDLRSQNYFCNKTKYYLPLSFTLSHCVCMVEFSRGWLYDIDIIIN